MKILYVTHHWYSNTHHAQNSGFQNLAVKAAERHEVTVVTWGKKYSTYRDANGIEVIEVKVAKRDLLFIKRLKLSRVASRISGNFDVIHALYSDCTFFLPKNKFVATFHVLPGIARYNSLYQRVFILLKYLLIQRRAMTRAAAIACVSSNLHKEIPVRFWNKTVTIPHGINSDYWNPYEKPDVKIAEQEFVLSVGTNGLDRELLRKIILKNPAIKFIIVGLKPPMTMLDNMKQLNNIDDEYLKQLYRQSSAVIKPLTFATANNSLLESLSMGKLVIASRVEGVTEYLPEDNCIFIDSLTDLHLNLPALKTIDAVRNSVISRFSWQKILLQYEELYHKTAERI